VGNSVANPRVLVFSLRNTGRSDPFRCPHYEFEDTIAEIDNVDIIAPASDPTSTRNQIAERLALRAPILLKADIERITATKRYDIFFAICGFSRDLLVVDAASHLWEACSTKVCLIDEIWANQIGKDRFYLDVLKKFDLVALYYSQSVDALSRQIGRRCIFVPPGIDALRFCPYPLGPKRVVDILSAGRKSQSTHQAILRMVDSSDLFYLYDTIKGDQVPDPKVHRRQYANIAKRSKYFIVNPGLIDRPDLRGAQIEIGNRYFEGAAAGTVLIGEIPDNGEFDKLFNWPDAVIHLPYGSDQIGGLVQMLEEDPTRCERIRRTNVTQVLRQHDWVYRWEAILNSVGLTAMPQLESRKRDLQHMVEQVVQSDATTASTSVAAEAEA
jgi:hypothetical protein